MNKIKKIKFSRFKRGLIIGPSGIGRAHFRQYYKNGIREDGTYKGYWKNKTAYFALSLLFWTDETDIEDIEFLLYFRCSATSQITMNTALKENISTTSNPPYISDVNSTTANATYGAGQNINVNLHRCRYQKMNWGIILIILVFSLTGECCIAFWKN